jgi:hypothetical protein
MKVQLADRESVIRCLELEATDFRQQISMLKGQIEQMVPKATHLGSISELSNAQTKINS